ncbi:hypothetical protein MKW94_029128 [Papaver nudicaule]|uniref:Uncharacterized protein n=1 Tax=Papaver nudicaule TaxID=74823 RepID=A0AA41VHU0_PAPNU|nr:hypothetical protein [Papaver nudicaule]
MANNGYYSSSSSYITSMSAQLWLVVLVLLSFLGFTLYINYESMVEGFMDQFKFGMMILPLVLLVFLYYSLSNKGGGSWVPSTLLPMPAKDSIHRAGGSPWGLGALLVFLIIMVSYQSDLHDSWFPLLRRS